MPNTPTRPVRNRLSLTNQYPYMRSNPRVIRRLFFAGPSTEGNNDGAGPSSSPHQSGNAKRRRRASESVEPEEEAVDVDMDVQADAPAAAPSNAPQSVGSSGAGIGSVVLLHHRMRRNPWVAVVPVLEVLCIMNLVQVSEKENHSSVLLPLAVVPVELLMFYISPAEYDRLPLSSRVQEVRVTVTPVGSKVCFSTNEAATKWTNSTQTMFGMSAYGLNKTGFSSNAKISTRNATQVMKPTAFEAWPIDSEIIISHDNDCLYSSTAASSYGRNGQCDFIVTGSDSAPNYYDNYHTFNVLCNDVDKK
ncbi:Capsid protein VP4 [Popillia japonica]|uniref:Capsid protein VP4 n=1 Tax=Popillia japonica TaxID=7064 RepID=A0AAW1JBW5_POPJA